MFKLFWMRLIHELDWLRRYVTLRETWKGDNYQAKDTTFPLAIVIVAISAATCFEKHLWLLPGSFNQM
jgi:hypothetical protein